MFQSWSVAAQAETDSIITGEILISIEDSKDRAGIYFIALFPSSTDWLKNVIMNTTASNIDGEIIASFKNVPPGVYGISLFYDKNENKKLDTGFMHIPKEPYACSNNAKGRFGPPKWKDAHFKVENTVVYQIIKI